MSKMLASMILLMLALLAPAEFRVSGAAMKHDLSPIVGQGNSIKVTIATVGPMLGPPTARFHVGEQIPVTIQLTNLSNQPVYSCVSSDLYQDLPRLTRNGRLLTYAGWQSYELRTAQKDKTCANDDLPNMVMLRPNESIIVDQLIVADAVALPTGADAWYEHLAPGTYQLTVQRRFDCCEGPMVGSNKITFTVIP